MMHYGKRKIEERQLLLRSKARRVHSFFKVMALRLLLIVSVIGVAAFFSGAYGALKGIISKAPSLTTIDKLPEDNHSIIYYSDGQTVANIVSDKFPTSKYVLYKNISENIINAFIALEDPDYYKHQGINVRSLFNNNKLDFFSSDDEENYTLTQKLLKYRIFPEYSNARYSFMQEKLQESYLAIRLEKNTSKEKIIEYYLNSLDVGDSHGIYSACSYYFQKEPSEVSLSEACVLAPAMLDPSNADPVYCNASNRQLRQTLLSRMLLLEFITRDQYDEAVADTDDVYKRISVNTESRSDYFSEALREQVLSDLIAKGYSSYEASALFYNGGLTIYSTQDKDIQLILSNEFLNTDNFPQVGDGSWYELSADWELTVSTLYRGVLKYTINDLLEFYADYEDADNLYRHTDGKNTGITTSTYSQEDLDKKIAYFISRKKSERDVIKCTEKNHIYTIEPQAAMVIMDTSSGSVVAIYGSRGSKPGPASTNRACEYYRSPGSAFLVPAVFMPALDSGMCTLASTFNDSYYSYTENDVTRTINNWYSTGYEGLSSIRRGIYHSMNIVSARCFDRIGAVSSLSYLRRLGFSKLNQAGDRGVSLAIGTLNGGVSLLELTSAYASVANNGIYNEPRFYSAVYDRHGNLLLGEKNKSRVTKTSTAVLLTDAMKDTIEKGTGTRCAFDEIDVEIAGKTGITENHSDLWFVGYTPYYCAGIWSGADTPTSLSQTQYHKNIWKNAMEKIHIEKGLTSGSFTLPENIVSCTICKKCGNLAVEGLCDCATAGDLTATEYFTEDTAPKTYCSCCRKIIICDETGMAASENCPDTHTVIMTEKNETPEAISHGGTADTAYCITPEMLYTCSYHRKKD